MGSAAGSKGGIEIEDRNVNEECSKSRKKKNVAMSRKKNKFSK